MANNQVQLRRDTATNLDAYTLAVGEPGYDTTNKRLRVGDGSTLGGLPIPTGKDQQNQAMVAATAGGSANALTLTISPAPTAYAARQKFGFIAASNNTGPATLKINSLPVTNFKRLIAGAKQNLSADDIVSGFYYEAIYDGTDFILLAAHELGYAASSEITVSAGDKDYTLTHGLGVAPRHAEGWLINKTTEYGFSVDQEAKVGSTYVDISGGGSVAGGTIVVDGTSVILAQINNLWVPDRSSNYAPSVITYANWKLILRCWA